VVICNSGALLRAATALAGSGDHIRVVHPPGAPAPDDPPSKRDEPTVATLAHVIPRKRHADVLQALHALETRLPELRWAVIGNGPSVPELQARARELGVDGRVEWLGELP